jgi:hypothetical protein
MSQNKLGRSSRSTELEVLREWALQIILVVAVIVPVWLSIRLLIVLWWLINVP